MIFALRMLGDLGLYFYFVGAFGVIAGSQTLFYLPLLWCTLSSVLSYSLRDRNLFLRCLPYGLIGLSAFTIRHRADMVMLAIPVIYLLFTAARGFYHAERIEIVKRFKLFILIMPILLLGVLVDPETIEKFVIPYGLLYVMISIYLMRLLRHDDDILLQPRFLLLNGLGLVGVCLAGIAISSPIFITGVKLLLQYVVVPVLMFIPAIILWIAMLFYEHPEMGPHIHEGVKWNNVAQQIEKRRHIPRWASDFSGAGEVFFALVGIGFALLMILVMRRLLGRKRPPDIEDGVVQNRSSLSPQEKSTMRLKRGDPRTQIRIAYQKFLKLCRKHGMSIPIWFTSKNVQDSALAESWCERKEAAELRELYLKARYSDNVITAEEAKQAGQGFAHLRKKARGIRHSSETE